MENHYLTAEEASKVLNLSRVQLYKLAQQNKLENIKIGGNILFPKEAIENYGSISIDIVPLAKNKKQLNYWMIPRSVRKLVTLQEMIKDDYRNGIIGGQWRGTRTNHLKRDLNLQHSGLRGKSPNGFVDANPGGARTDVALLAALGFYAFDKEGNIELTYQGEQMLISTNPALIITQQLFQFRYPSPYSNSIRLNPDFELFPYRFLFQLLINPNLVDNGSIIDNDGIIRLTQDEIALFVITEAKKDNDLNRIINLILDYRQLKSHSSYPIPTDTLKNIANTFINNIEITGFINREKKGTISLKEDSIFEVFQLLDAKPRNFKYEIGKENEFQHRLGMNPTKTKFTHPQVSNRSGSELAVKHLLMEELSNNPMTIDDITPSLIKDIAQRVGTTIETTNKVIAEMLKEDPQDIFSKQYILYASSGRSLAREFEVSTSKIIKEIFGNSKWTGKEGKSPDVTFNISSDRIINIHSSLNPYKDQLVAEDKMQYTTNDDHDQVSSLYLLNNNKDKFVGIIDCKAETNYTISNDHFNRMTVETDGYIPNYNADIFIYVAHGFGNTFIRGLKKVEHKSNIPGSGITANTLLHLLKRHREQKFTINELYSLFTIGRIITVADINELNNHSS